MKFFVKLLIAAVVIAILLPFTILKGTDGRPLMSIDDLKFSELSLPEIPGAVKNSVPNSGSVDIIYKWKDDKGELHFSSSPPPEGTEFTSKGYDPNTNLIQSVETQVEVLEQPDADGTSQIKKASDIGNPYSPAKVDKLIKDAQNIEKLLNDRLKKQEALLN